ncbi:PDR/VanB family oxidoreductase [Silvanigrella aquatica]|uniref:Ferredoxin--NADP(+) reductase n=1 Tax=Silvanigrella aquatica TaxID=1915309 RepID=A0A1L4D3S1_9BACT|nr:PDR/VanB family oxidoreductase [Silvanigrella aquatica]APJ04856.1 ferredoxin--NADP(+) reductase [Silvanigrella aquatica]
MKTIRVKIVDIECITPFIKQFVLMRKDKSLLPSFSAGSHIVIIMNSNDRIIKNPYSLMSSPFDTKTYQIAIRKQEKSRGGSHYMHEKVFIGSELEISYPVNLFPLYKKAKKHILFAGGIGITPFISQIYELNNSKSNFEMHYSFREKIHGSIAKRMEDLNKDYVNLYNEDKNEFIEFNEILKKQPLGTHVYVCGSKFMIYKLIDLAINLGWPLNHIHSEQFISPPIGEGFLVYLAKSNKEIFVDAEKSILESIENAGVKADYLCRGGSCGKCELEVLENNGIIYHHDNFLTETEKKLGKKILPCVSRAKSDKLTLNI